MGGDNVGFGNALVWDALPHRGASDSDEDILDDYPAPLGMTIERGFTIVNPRFFEVKKNEQGRRINNSCVRTLHENTHTFPNQDLLSGEELFHGTSVRKLTTLL